MSGPIRSRPSTKEFREGYDAIDWSGNNPSTSDTEVGDRTGEEESQEGTRKAKEEKRQEEKE